MNATTLIACSPPDSGAQYHPDCCPDVDACEDSHSAVFGGAEVQCSPSTCDECGESIEGETILHSFRRGTCEYCGEPHECEFGAVSLGRLTGEPSRACECGQISLDLED